MKAYVLQPAVLAKHFSITATFFLKRKCIVHIVDNLEIIGYTEFPQEDAPLEIYISYTNEIYTDEDGNRLPDDEVAYLMYGALAHEILHQIYSPFESIKLEKKRVIHDILFLDIVNAVEDCAIEGASPAIYGGTMLDALGAIIRHLYNKALPIDYGVPEGDTKWAIDQLMNALIIIGDRGPLKGSFVTDEAKNAFEAILPIWNEAIMERSGDKRVILSRRIYNIMEPLVEKPYEQKVEHANQSHNGDGQPIPQYNDYDLNKAKKEKSDDTQTVKGTRTPEPEDTEGDVSKSESKTEEKPSDAQKSGNSEGKSDQSREGNPEKGSESPKNASEGAEEDSAVNGASDEENTQEAPGGASGNDSERESGGQNEEKVDSGSNSSKTAPDSEEDNSGDDSDGESEAAGSMNENGSDETGSDETETEMGSESGTDKAGTVGGPKNDSAIDETSKKKFEEEVEKTAKKLEEEAAQEYAEIASRESDLPESGAQSTNTRVEYRSSDEYEYAALVEKNATRIDVLSRNLKRIFRGDSDGKMYANHGSKIEPKRIADGRMHTRIMTNRNVPKELRNMAISILVDESRSMRGKKIENARDCCITLYEAMERLGIPISVTGFSTKGVMADNRHYVTWHKSKHDKVALAQISERKANLDFLSLRDTMEMLGKCDAKHKLLIVLSDGQPCSLPEMTRYDAQLETKKAIENVRKKGISIVGVAIEAGNEMIYADMYGRDFITISNVDQMTQEVCKAIAGAITSW